MPDKQAPEAVHWCGGRKRIVPYPKLMCSMCGASSHAESIDYVPAARCQQAEERAEQNRLAANAAANNAEEAAEIAGGLTDALMSFILGQATCCISVNGVLDDGRFNLG